ncbi:HpcH/HpaI aldolase/citrate lyase family protein [Streptacidiphilus fuscans]|uniref:HpcH/HpaI aldolase/citrate lyase family protein n=1 Tax=Streptacidiphilus fuscans TaxID=2789292 RepID=A0A931BGT9_9ACTN|nr:HpcH/HpaI aldolase/citrate lyase family protein [Streptacidiphilus fuscans]MBF9073185.1 HpcH/HpaI aldolase/citrate lyase family protein [Streptacidiphilus fuscans]
MRHFGQLDEGTGHRLFLHQPQPFRRDSDAAQLAVALGATLYSPATRPRLADDVRRQAAHGVVSMVLCLEDAVGDAEVPAAERNLVAQLRTLAAGVSEASGSSAVEDELPLLFVRVRRPEQIADLAARLGGEALALLSGFVVPKFTEESGLPFLEALAELRAASGLPLYAMPVLESPRLAHLESRAETLLGVARLLEKYRELVLAVRLGVTDLCSAYGLRRPPELTAYDVQLVAAVIGDVVNVLGRADGTGHVLTGPVWEYFPVQERKFKPQLRQSPFEEAEPPAGQVRRRLIDHDLDGLIRELELDRANGLLGKTCIHPSHVPAVHAMSVATHEEWSDARDILSEDRAGGGVMRSAYVNKMNEVKPHRAWAQRVMARAAAFGVAREDVSFADLLAACVGA